MSLRNTLTGTAYEKIHDIPKILTLALTSDLYKFIAAGRLNCVIDRVNGVIETNRPDAKNAQYQTVIKQGDLLLNRIQKLSRVIDV